ncbi:MAG: serine hydrolase domain-containing protein [Propioniciclava sp.]|uniref:serine hydrolase domain-containing protein n=1 Tax=Propioniciclava sp. TaxID=2038686 RepID=UPI0039E538BB
MTTSPDSTPATAAGRSRRTRVLPVVAVAVLVLTLAGIVAPRPITLGPPTGDRRLADAARPHLSGQHHVAIALIEPEGVRYAGFGADEHAVFEIGSVTKTFTSALLREAIARGEVSADTRVRDLVPTDAPVGDVTLQELASHTSGLPRLGGSQTNPVSLFAHLLRRNPYSGDGELVIRDALAAGLTDRGTVAYSNLGVALLGQLLARAADLSYPDLLRMRLLDPLGLAETTLPLTASDLPPEAPRGYDVAGRTAAAWPLDGWSPAGGVRSTAHDLAIWVESMLDGRNPGASGLGVVAEVAPGDRVATGWFLQDLAGGGTLVWHNGGTGGFRSFVGFDPDARRGIVVLADTERDVDAAAVAILKAAR